MTVAYVIEACLFLTLLSWARRPAGVVNSWVMATSQTTAIRWHYVREVV